MVVKFVAGKTPKVVAFLLASCFSFASLLFASGRLAAGDAFAQETAAAAGAWQTLSAREDNFSVALPVRPEITGHSNFAYGERGAHVEEERVASAYRKGVVYLVRMLTTPDAKRLLSNYVSIRKFPGAEESNLKMGDIEGKQYFIRGEGHVHFVRLFRTKKRLYVLEAAARDEGNADIQRFFSSLTLDGAAAPPLSVSSAAGTNASKAEPFPVASDLAPLTEKEVTRPAVVIYKPQPPYPARAKQMRASGTVRYSVVLSPSGEVTNIKITQDQLGGQAEALAQVVKSVKFLPAEKDGRLVPQQSEIFYNFILKY